MFRIKPAVFLGNTFIGIVIVLLFEIFSNKSLKMRVILVFFFLIISTCTFAQDKWALGPMVSYNFALKSTGIGLRSTIPLSDKLILNPQVKYFPSFNTIDELFAGVNLQYVLVSSEKERSYNRYEHIGGKPSLYLTAGVDYNNWLNYDPSTPSVKTNATANNVLPNVGIGSVIGGKVVRIFAEARYNVLWNESFGEFGILIYPGNITGRNKSLACPGVK